MYTEHHTRVIFVEHGDRDVADLEVREVFLEVVETHPELSVLLERALSFLQGLPLTGRDMLPYLRAGGRGNTIGRQGSIVCSKLQPIFEVQNLVDPKFFQAQINFCALEIL